MSGQRGESVLFEQVGDRSVKEASRTRGTSEEEFIIKFSSSHRAQVSIVRYSVKRDAETLINSDECRRY